MLGISGDIMGYLQLDGIWWDKKIAMKSAALCPALSLLKGIYLWDDSCHKAKSTRRNLDFHPQHVRNRIRNRIRNSLCYPLVNYQKPWKDPPKSPLFPWEHSRTFNGHGFQFANCKKLPGRVPSPTIPKQRSPVMLRKIYAEKKHFIPRGWNIYIHLRLYILFLQRTGISHCHFENPIHPSQSKI